MKEFEKWLNKNYSRLFMNNTSFEYPIKEAWKAALQWVLSEEAKDDDGDYIDITWKINEELNGKTKKRHRSSLCPCSQGFA